MRWLILTFILFLPSTAHGDFLDQVKIAYYPPGSLRTIYGGPHKAINDYAQKYLRDVWEDEYRIRYDYGLIDHEAYQCGITRVANAINDSRNGGRWWNRRWFEHREEEDGGAPHQHTRHIGSTYLLADLWLCRLYNDFSCKNKQFEGLIDVHSYGDKEFSGSGWKFILSPDVIFKTTYYVNNLFDLLRSVSIMLHIYEIDKFRNRLGFEFGIRHYFDYNGTMAYFSIGLMMW